MEHPAEGGERLDSWKAIGNYLGKDSRTAMRWEQDAGMPVHRVPGRRVVFAYAQELDRWLRNGRPVAATSGLQPAAPSAEGGANGRGLVGSGEGYPSATAVAGTAVGLDDRTRGKSRHRITSWYSLCAALLVAVGAVALWSAPRPIQLTGETQLTNNGTEKLGLLTDGHELYFSEYREGRAVLSSVSTAGGPIKTIPTPFLQANPVSLSPNGRNLLVLAREGEEEEQELWIVPVDGGSAQRVSNVVCHDAVWAPDGRRIAFAYGNAIYLTTDGSTRELVQSFTGIPSDLRWSLDGDRMLFRLRDPSSWNFVIWELALDGPANAQLNSLVPISLKPANYTPISSVMDASDAAFIGLGKAIYVDEKDIYSLASAVCAQTGLS